MTSRPWLRPVIKGLLRLAFRVYYRSIQVQGMEHFPREGPVLLVANHPSSLLDPAVLVYLLSRPVHFGAKHTLFSGPFGAVLEAFGAIPLVRAQDDRRPMERNLEAFERFTALLGEGRVTAIFPEGLPQDEPHLSPVKTGAARIALQAEDGGRLHVETHRGPCRPAVRAAAAVSRRRVRTLRRAVHNQRPCPTACRGPAAGGAGAHGPDRRGTQACRLPHRINRTDPARRTARRRLCSARGPNRYRWGTGPGASWRTAAKNRCVPQPLCRGRPESRRTCRTRIGTLRTSSRKSRHRPPAQTAVLFILFIRGYRDQPIQGLPLGPSPWQVLRTSEPAAAERELLRDAKGVLLAAQQLDRMQEHMTGLRTEFLAGDRSFLTQQDHDEIRALLLAYLDLRSALLKTVWLYRGDNTAAAVTTADPLDRAR